MKQQRDMTDAQFRAALKKHGITSEGFMGYVCLGPETSSHTGSRGVNVSVLNCGSKRRRTVLAYLLQQQDHWREVANDERAAATPKLG